MKNKVLTTRNLVLIAMLAAIAAVLTVFDFPLLFIAPNFYKLDFSEVPILIGTFAMGPVAGMLMKLVKILLNLLFNGTSTAYIGELANFIMGCAFVVPAGIIYKINHTRKGAMIALGSSIVIMTVAACLVNGLLLLPWYASHFFASAGGMDAILQAGAKVHPSIGTLPGFLLLCVAPFNLVKGILSGLITAVLYKRVSFLIKGTRAENKMKGN